MGLQTLMIPMPKRAPQPQGVRTPVSEETRQRRRMIRRLRSGRLNKDDLKHRHERNREFRLIGLRSYGAKLVERDYDAEAFVTEKLREANIQPDQAQPIQFDRWYWVARNYCGWDALCAVLRDVGPTPDGWDVLATMMRDALESDDGRRMLANPVMTAFWEWWTKLHPKTRDSFVDDSTLEACPGCPRVGPDGIAKYGDLDRGGGRAVARFG